MESSFTVTDDDGRSVDCRREQHSWHLRGLRIDGVPRVMIDKDGSHLITLSVREARDLSRALDMLLGTGSSGGGRSRRPRDPSLPANTGKPWSEQSDQLLRQRWLGGACLSELTSAFERTRGAVVARIVRLELEENKERVREEDKRRREETPEQGEESPAHG